MTSVFNKPKRFRSNLSASERSKDGGCSDFSKIDEGFLRIVKADKGGALCIMDKAVMRYFELERMGQTDRYQCLGEIDPFSAAQLHVRSLALWRRS